MAYYLAIRRNEGLTDATPSTGLGSIMLSEINKPQKPTYTWFLNMKCPEGQIHKTESAFVVSGVGGTGVASHEGRLYF